MFFSQLFLSKKGVLGPIWIAAHLERRLRKSQVYETNIPATVDNIIHPEVPIALRLSGHLLLGVVRIYSKKVAYLYTDCNDTLNRLKQAFARMTVDLPPEATASFAAVTIPERYEQLEELAILPENHLLGFADNSITTREQITLPDNAPSVFDEYALGSQFGLDERLPAMDDTFIPEVGGDRGEARDGEQEGFLAPMDFDVDELMGPKLPEMEAASPREGERAEEQHVAAPTDTETVGLEPGGTGPGETEELREGGVDEPGPAEGEAAEAVVAEAVAKAAAETQGRDDVPPAEPSPGLDVEVEVARSAAGAPSPGAEGVGPMSPGVALRPEAGPSATPASEEGVGPWMEETPVADGSLLGKRKLDDSGGGLLGSGGLPSVSPASMGEFVTPEIPEVPPEEPIGGPLKRARAEAGEAGAEVEGVAEGVSGVAPEAAAPEQSTRGEQAAAEMPPPPARKPPRPRKRRAPPVDSNTVIPSERMREQLSSSDDIVCKRRRAAHTPAELESQGLESLGMEDFFRTPAVQGLGPALSRLYMNLAPEASFPGLTSHRAQGEGTPLPSPHRQRTQDEAPAEEGAPRGQAQVELPPEPEAEVHLQSGDKEGEGRQEKAGSGQQGGPAENVPPEVARGGEGELPGAPPTEGAAVATPHRDFGGEVAPETQAVEGAAAVSTGPSGPGVVVEETPFSPDFNPATPFTPGFPLHAEEQEELQGEGAQRTGDDGMDGVAGNVAPGAGAQEVLGEGSGAAAPAEGELREGAGLQEAGDAAGVGEEGGKGAEGRDGEEREEEVVTQGVGVAGEEGVEGPGMGLDYPGLVVIKPDAASMEFLKDSTPGRDASNGKKTAQKGTQPEAEEDPEATGGWSIRSRGALKMFRETFTTLQEQELAGGESMGRESGAARPAAAHSVPPAVSLFGLVEGANRKEAARMFFETLVLTTRGCVEVVQQQAYGDVAILASTGLMAD